MKTIADLAYSSQSPSHKLDLYLPEPTEGELPLVVFIHGGAWMEGDKKDGQQKPWVRLTEYGYAVASVNYRLSGEAVYPAGINDCRRAVRWLYEHAEEYGLDRERIALSGGSSGGHYALMAGMARGSLFPPENYTVRCMIGWYPVCDLGSVLRSSLESDRSSAGEDFAVNGIQNLFGKAITDPVSTELMMASPSFYIRKDMPPVLLQHGTDDSLCPPDQTMVFYEACIAAGARASFDLLFHAKHMDRKFGDEENRKKVVAFLDTWMKNK